MAHITIFYRFHITYSCLFKIKRILISINCSGNCTFLCIRIIERVKCREEIFTTHNMNIKVYTTKSC